MATEDDWKAYRTAVVDVAPTGRPGFRIVPDRPGAVGAWPDRVAAPVVVVTAWNPGGVRLDADANAARGRRLDADLDARALARWPAIGRGPVDGHHEAGVAVPGLDEDEGRALGRLHGQAAVYVWTPGAWEVVACDSARRHTLGWRLTGVPAGRG